MSWRPAGLRKPFGLRFSHRDGIRCRDVTGDRFQGNLAPSSAVVGRGRRLASLAVATILATILAAMVPSVVLAAERAYMVIDANTGAVLSSSEADEPRYPASLTKMMTLYMAFELIEKGRLTYTDKITISAQAAAQPPSKLDLDAGDTILVRDAVKALVTKSANDIAVALAEHIGGSEVNFARLMTKKAHEIGMNHTTFKNASGLPNDEQTTTARDMLTLALRLQDDFPSHYKVFATKSFTYAGSTYRSHNTLLYHYNGTDGIKTGYTRASGFNLVTSVKRDGRHLVAAVFGGNTAGSRNAQMRAMLDRAFAKASTRRTRRKTPLLVAEPKPAERPVAGGWATATSAATNAAKQAQAQAQAHALARRDAKPLASAPPPARAPEPEVRTASADAEPAPRADDLTSRITVARVRPISFDNAAQPPGPPLGTVGAQANGAIVPRPSASAPVAQAAGDAAPDETAKDTAKDTAPGRPPSTLHEQLARILASNSAAPAAEQPAYSLRGPAAAPEASVRAEVSRSAAARGGYLVQVGAFNSPGEAAKHLDSVRSQLSEMLAAAAPVTEPVDKGDRKFYRARFAGFDQKRATAVCTEMRRRSIDCLVARAQ